MKVANPIERALLARVKTRENGWVFAPNDFHDLGSRQAVDKALSRMAAARTIHRIVRGLYYVPQKHPIVGLTPPHLDKIVQALASKASTRVQPTGGYAANLLGLSDQVPVKVVFLTDGRSKRLRLGKLDIVLKQTSPRNMATAGRISGLVIQSLRYLGKGHVSYVTVKRLDRRLSPDDRKHLLKDVPYAPAWVGEIMQRLAGKG
jgi:hypothetical protein